MSDYKYSIHATNVDKIYHRKNKIINALIDFNININRGSIHGLLGPNGAGKSTFINILGGLVKKNRGKIKICGLDIDKYSKLSKFKIGIVPQELNIDPFFSPIQLLELQAGLYGIPKRLRRTEEILDNLKLLEQKNAYARTLSGGMRRRLLIAKALVHNPEMLILDEPTAGVDVEIRASIWEYIKKINKKGTTICLTTHYLEEAEKLCDKITIINNGKIVKEDTKNNLLNYNSLKKAIFTISNKVDISKEKLVFKYRFIEDKLEIEYDKSKVSLSDIIDFLKAKGFEYSEIKTINSSLEEIFIKLTQN